MELTITNQKENKILKRKEIEGTITFTGATPSNTQVQEEIAKKLNIQKEKIVTKQIINKFGTTNATFKAYAYETEEQLKIIEPKKKVKAK